MKEVLLATHLRGCLQSEGSSSFWIILAAFRLQAWWGHILLSILPPSLASKIGSKESKNRQNLALQTPSYAQRKPYYSLLDLKKEPRNSRVRVAASEETKGM